MKRISIVLAALAAVLAFSGAAASSASAGVLFETEEGNFPVAYSGVSTEAWPIETTNGSRFQCSEMEIKGEIGDSGAEVGTKFAHLFSTLILFKGCKNTILGGGNCENAGAGTKEIHLEPFVGHLGLTHSPTNLHIPAVLLLPAVEYECTVLGVKDKVKVTGNLIGEIENPQIGTFKNTLSLSFKKEAGKAGVQEYKEFLLSLVPESESLMTNEHLTTESLGKTEETSVEGRITLTSTKNLRLVEI